MWIDIFPLPFLPRPTLTNVWAANSQVSKEPEYDRDKELTEQDN